MMARRDLLGAGLAACAPAWADEDDAPTRAAIQRRILGTYRSDAARTVAYYGAVGRPLTDRERTLFEEHFGRMLHVITPRTFSALMAPRPPYTMRYRIAAFTSSSVTLALQDGSEQVLYLTDEGHFIKTGARGGRFPPIIEYFRRVA